jgi:hypothetical protein
MEHRIFGQCQVRRGTITTAVRCASAPGRCALPVVEYKSGRVREDFKLGAPPDFFFCIQFREQLCQQRISFQQNIHYCTYKRIFAMLCLRSIDGDSMGHSWGPVAVNGPIVRFIKIFFFEQLSMSYIREIWSTNRERSKAFNALKTKRVCFIHGLIAYRAVNTLRLGYKNQSVDGV